jgi:hypothetical protein
MNRSLRVMALASMLGGSAVAGFPTSRRIARRSPSHRTGIPGDTQIST